MTCLKEIHKKTGKEQFWDFFRIAAVKGSGLGRGNLSNDKETAFYFCKLG